MKMLRILTLSLLGICCATAAGEDPKPAKPAPRLDRYGDPLPEGAVARLGTVRWRMTYPHCAAFTPDGKSILVTRDKRISFLDAETGAETRAIRIDEPISQFALSRDGKLLVTASRLALHVWDVATDKTLKTIPVNPCRVDAMSFSPDGRYLAVDALEEIKPGPGQSQHTVSVYEGATWNLLWKNQSFGEGNLGGSAGFLADGNSLIRRTNTGRAIVAVHSTSGNEKGEITSVPEGWHFRALSPDGSLIALVGDLGGIRILDAATGKTLRHLEGHATRVLHFAFSPNGKLVASDADGEKSIRIWDVETGKELKQVDRGFDRYYLRLVLSPDGERLLVPRAYAHVINLRTGKSTSLAEGHSSAAYPVEFTPDMQSVITWGMDGTVSTWDVATWKERQRFETGERSFLRIALSHDGKTLACSMGTVTGVSVWSFETAKRLYHIQSGRQMGNLAFSPDGKLLGIEKDFNGGRVGMWDVVTGKEVWQSPENHFSFHGFTSDGRFFITTDYNKHFLWQVGTWKLQRTIEFAPLVRLMGPVSGPFTILPDGRKFWCVKFDTLDPANFANWTSHYDLFEIATAKKREEHRFPVPMRYSPDERMCTLSNGDLKDAWTGELLQGAVGNGVFSADGRLLVSVGGDGSILAWDLTRFLAKRKPRPLSDDQTKESWSALHNPDAAVAWDSIKKLALADDQAVSFLKTHLKPAPPVDAERVKRLIADLDSERFATREQANRELEQLGQPALELLRMAAPSAEGKRRLEGLIEKLEKGELSQDDLRILRAVEVLEMVGSKQAREVLESLAKGEPAAWLTAEATLSLSRLAKREVR